MDDEKVSLKEIREKFYEIRSFEISNLWQRSIFLSALLVLFFSAYGFLISKLVENEVKINYLLINQICCVVALFAIVFSIIWIMMAKGSKAWFEVYERRILDIEEEKELGIPENYRMVADCTPWDLDSNLLSNRAGAYSVSKINILIGKFLMIMWIMIFFIHYVWAWTIVFDKCIIIDIVILTLLPVFLFVILVTAFCNMWAKSNSVKALK